MRVTRQQTASIQSKIIEELEALPDAPIAIAWSAFEDGLLRKYYGVKRTADLAKILKRSAYSVQRRASSIGITKGRWVNA